MTTDPKPSQANWPIASKTVLFGAIVGGVAALLIPLAGRRLRRRGPARTAHALRQAKRSLYDAARGVAETATDFAAVGKKNMQASASAASDAASDLVDAGRKRAQKEALRLANAVNAGAEAYSRGA